MAGGTILIVLGIVALIAGQRFKGYLLSALGVLVLMDSLLSIQTSIDAKKFGLSAWSGILAASILSGALGGVLIITDAQTIVGCSLLAEGFMRHYIVRCTVYLSPDYDPSSQTVLSTNGCKDKIRR